MSLKHKIFKRHFDHIEDIISHAPFAYLKVIIWYILIALVIGGYWLFYSRYGGIFNEQIVKSVLAGLAAIAYISFLVRFFDIYLDSIILTPEALFVHRRNGFLQNSQVMIPRDGLESVSYTQRWLVENLFKFWDIVLSHINGKDIFKDVPYPRQNAQKIIAAKKKFLKPSAEAIESQKLQILIEALGEVVSEYMQNHYRDPSNEQLQTDI